MARSRTSSAWSGGRFQKADNRKPRKYGHTKESSGLPTRKTLNVGNELIQITFAESVRDVLDLISRTPDILSRLRDLAEFIGCPAERTRHAAHKNRAGGLLLLDGIQKLFACFRCFALSATVVPCSLTSLAASRTTAET
jgi:hypothetical protein